MDGASPLRMFFSIILPLLQPAIITVIVTSAVGIYNLLPLKSPVLPHEWDTIFSSNMLS
jgi:ABC-type glycerol-3-phosphate transport system permease component